MAQTVITALLPDCQPSENICVANELQVVNLLPMNGRAAVAETSPPEIKTKTRWLSGPAIVLYLAALKFLLHIVSAGRYGMFRDELYYLACGQHLAWGYVDQPPLIALIAWFARHIFGESLYGLRLLPALAGAALVWIAGELAREMGGGRVAQIAAASAVFAAPIYLVFDHWLTMNAFDPLFWMGCAWCVLRVINSGDGRWWILFGILAGLGLENKYSIAFFLGALLVGLLLTPQRKILRGRYFWLGISLAVAIALPNFIWEVTHHFPFLELMHNIRSSNRDVVRGPVAFIADQAMILNPASFLLWAGGTVWLLVARRARAYRAIGICFVLALVLFIAMKGKNYYVAPAYPVVFAAGGVGLEAMTRDRRMRFLAVAYVALILIAGAILAPTMTPLLSPEAYLRYQRRLGLTPPKAENQPTGPLPQYLADEFGWEEMAREVARAYHSLTPDEQAHTAIFAENYGEAGAIDFFGPKYGLPRAICAHQSNWYWGPRQYTGESMLIVGSDGKGLDRKFRSYRVVGHVEHPYSRLDEHFDLYLGQGLNWNLQTIWPKLKKWS
jgi:hypothetical protein